jgi:acetyl-CoA carboxylase carboxyltransferase component
MGPAGKDFVYKDEMRQLTREYQEAIKAGESEQSAAAAQAAGLAKLSDRYEQELMNPKEALALGSVSSIVRPGESRRVLAENLSFLMRHYQPSAMGGTHREHE